MDKTGTTATKYNRNECCKNQTKNEITYMK